MQKLKASVSRTASTRSPAGVRVTVGSEGDPLTVGRPTRTKIGGMVGQIAVLMSRKIQQPDIRHPASARGDKGKGRAVWRKCSLVFVSRIARQPLQPAAIRVNPVNIRRASTLGCENDPSTVRGK